MTTEVHPRPEKQHPWHWLRSFFGGKSSALSPVIAQASVESRRQSEQEGLSVLMDQLVGLIESVPRIQTGATRVASTLFEQVGHISNCAGAGADFCYSIFILPMFQQPMRTVSHGKPKMTKRLGGWQVLIARLPRDNEKYAGMPSQQQFSSHLREVLSVDTLPSGASLLEIDVAGSTGDAWIQKDSLSLGSVKIVDKNSDRHWLLDTSDIPIRHMQPEIPSWTKQYPKAASQRTEESALAERQHFRSHKVGSALDLDQADAVHITTIIQEVTQALQIHI